MFGSVDLLDINIFDVVGFFDTCDTLIQVVLGRK